MGGRKECWSADHSCTLVSVVVVACLYLKSRCFLNEGVCFNHRERKRFWVKFHFLYWQQPWTCCWNTEDEFSTFSSDHISAQSSSLLHRQLLFMESAPLPTTVRDPRWLIRSPKVKMDSYRLSLDFRGKGMFWASRHQKLNCGLGDVLLISFSLSTAVREKPTVSVVSRRRSKQNII